MQVAITAIGTANPPFKRSQTETADLIAAGLDLKASERRLLKSIYKATGIAERYSILSDYCKNPGEFEFFPNNPQASFPTTASRMAIYRENAFPLALKAIEECFQSHPDIDKNNITHLITVSCTGMYAPGIDIEIVQYLKLNPTIKRTAINFMGCYGAFNAIKVAESFCKANSDAKILIVCIELCTIHFQKKMDTPNMISNAIFSDGAAAVLIESTPNHLCLTLDAFYCDLLPQTNDEMTWHIADNGFDIMLSTYVPEILQSGIKHFIQNLLNQQKMSFNQIDFYAIHPGGLKILQACEAALDITIAQNHFSYEVLKNYGNMSSPTVLFVLKKIWETLKNNDHQKTIFACAFGPGLTFESMILRVQCGQ